MSKEATIVLLSLSYLLSGAIVYSQTYGITKPVRQVLTWVPVLGLIYYGWKGKNPIDDSFVFGLVTGPIAVGLLYELFDMVCWRVNKRSFHLHAAGAKHMKGLGLPWDNNHYKWTDIVFSVILILMWIGWPILYVVLIHLAIK